MKADIALDYAIFELDPTRSRCELLVAAGGTTEKLATGSFNPFLLQLEVAQEQIAKGTYSVRLQAPPAPATDGGGNDASWFSKGTLQRFVRFVSTPEILERLSSLEDEYKHVEEAINILAAEPTKVCDTTTDASTETAASSGREDGGKLASDNVNNLLSSEGGEGFENTGDSSKKQLLRAMDSCRFMLLKEQQKAYAQAVAAGFDAECMADMLVFADTFRANRLRDACSKFIDVSKKNQLCNLPTISQTESIGAAENVLSFRNGIALNDELDGIKDPVNQNAASVGVGSDEFSSGDSVGNFNSTGLMMPDKSPSPTHSGLRLPRAFYQSSSLIPKPSHISANGPRDLTRLGHLGMEQHPTEDEVAQKTKPRRYSLEGGLNSSLILSPQGSRLPRRFGPSAAFGVSESQDQTFDRPTSGDRENHKDHSKEMQILKDCIGLVDQHLDCSTGHKCIPSAGQSLPRNYHGVHVRTGRNESGSSAHDPVAVEDVSDCCQMHIDSSSGNSVTKLPVHCDLSVPQSPSEVTVSQTLETEENVSARSPVAETKSSEAVKYQDNRDSFLSRISVRRSTSPRRRSFSPHRKVQINRSPARRPVLIIKNLSYSSPSSHDQCSAQNHQYHHSARASKDRPLTREDSDSLSENEESHAQKGGNRRLSVQAAISLFESRQKDSNAGSQKQKLGQIDPPSLCSEAERTISSQKSVLRRWSISTDTSTKCVQQSFEVTSNEDFECTDGKPALHDYNQRSENIGVSTRQSKPSVQLEDMELLHQLRYESSIQLLERNMKNSHIKSSPNPAYPDSGSVTKQQVFSAASGCSDDMSMSIERDTENQQRWSWGPQHSGTSVTKEKPVGKISADLLDDDGFFMKDRIIEGIGMQPIAESIRHHAVAQHSVLTPTEISSFGQDVTVGSNAPECSDHDEFQVKSIVEDTNSKWKASIDLQPELDSSQSVSGQLKGPKKRTKHLSTELTTEHSFVASKCSTANGSTCQSRNDSSDYDMLPLQHVSNSNAPRGLGGEVTQESDASSTQKGRFYEQYIERRDAKFRQESSTKRAEREAKLKAMREVLERRKAELAARNMLRSAERPNLFEDQSHLERSYVPGIGLVRSNKEKEFGLKPQLEELQEQQSQAVQGNPIISMPTEPAASTPRSSRHQASSCASSIARKHSPSSQKSLTSSSTPRSTARSAASSSPKSGRNSSATPPSAGQRRASNVREIYVASSRVVTSGTEPRKENTKPLVKSTTLMQQETTLSARGIKSKASNSLRRNKHMTAIVPLESNGIVSPNSTLQTSAFSDDKKPKSITVRKIISTASESKATQPSLQEERVISPLKVPIRDFTAEPSPQNKAYKIHIASTLPHEVKPFLRKGRGIGPGAGPGVLKLKATLAAEAAKTNDDDSLSKVDGSGSDDTEIVSGFMPESASTTQSLPAEPIPCNPSFLNTQEEATDAMGKSFTSFPFPASISERTELPQKSDELFEKLDQGSVHPYQTSMVTVLSEAEQTTPSLSVTPHSAFRSEESQPAEPLQQISDDLSKNNNCVPVKFATLQQYMSINEDYPLLISPSDMSMSQMISPESRGHMSLPQMISPESHSRRLSVASSSPFTSPASYSFPHSRYSLSPNIDSETAKAVQSGNKWGSSPKMSVTDSQAAPKGFKRLLKFGRKNRSSNNGNSEWVSASTTSGEDDVDESLKDVGNKSSEDTTRSAVMSLIHLYKSDNATKVSDGECATAAASRSFFSLSAFRKQKP